MLFKEMFKKTTYISLDGSRDSAADTNSPSVPDGLFTKCDACGEMIFTEDLESQNMVCPKCGHYFRIGARARIEMVADKDTFEEWDCDIQESNPIEYPGYTDKIIALKEKTGIDEAVVTGIGKIDGRSTVLAICDTSFLMGSMGHVVGEKITRAVEKATKNKLPIIIFTCSGGARMQEGIVSLMQMAKTSAAIKRHDEAGLLTITVLTDPTTGGVTASFAMLGDIILAEPGALIGFAGPRVIKQTIGQDLPEGFQRAEFLLQHGLIDNIVQRAELRATLSLLIKYHTNPKSNRMKEYGEYLDAKIMHNTKRNEQESYTSLTAWDRVKCARSNERPTALDYIENLTKDFYELHGDRAFKDDGAVVGGIALFGKQAVTVIGQQKGNNTKENIKRNFGMPYPEGYRKALRLMKQAEKFQRPIVCFIDTPGAYCGIGAEERGQGEAIARNLYEMAALKVPVLSIVIGEGGSGGALALGVANEVWMMENAIYSVLSPEGFASILWKDASKAEKAAEVMKITAQDIKDLGIINQIIEEEEPITKDNIKRSALFMKRKIVDFMLQYGAMSDSQLVDNRYERFRVM